MVTAEQKQFYEDNGYLIIKNVLSKEDIAFLRKRILEIFDSGEWKACESNTEKNLVDVYRYFPDLMRVSLSKKVVDTVKSLLGSEDVILTPETSVMKAFYPTWHKDTTTPEKYGHSFHKRPDFRMTRCGIYLQPNNHLGGGLSVIAGSHKVEDNFHKPFPERTIWRRLKYRLVPNAEEKDKFLNPHGLKMVDIPSEIGDMIVFNFQTAHKGTIPKSQRLADVPADQVKIGMFDTFGVRNEATQMYVDFLKTRPENIYSFSRNRKQSQEFDDYVASIGLGAL